jgi:predicted ATPase
MTMRADAPRDIVVSTRCTATLDRFTSGRTVRPLNAPSLLRHAAGGRPHTATSAPGPYLDVVQQRVKAHSPSVYVAAIHSSGFRNLAGRFPLSSPLSVILGANNAGKSNLVDACRALFTPEVSPRARHWITVDDFSHDGTGHRICEELELEAELAGLDEADQGRMVTCLSPKLGPGEGPAAATSPRRRHRQGRHRVARRRQRTSRRRALGPRCGHLLTYLHPLRDAAADLRPGRENRLAHLLDALAPGQHADRAAVEQIVKDANKALAAVDAIDSAQTEIRTCFTAMTGQGVLSQHSALAFAKPEYSRIVSTLRALAGQAHPLELAENGLGYNNLLYMAVLLSALAGAPEDGSLRILLVEEPEAHLHPQLQDLLMRYLESQSSPATQVVMTSHSPNFAEATQVERVTVMTRSEPEAQLTGRRPTDFGLAVRELAHLRRFLDVTKSALLFAPGVILVRRGRAAAATRHRRPAPAIARHQRRHGRQRRRSRVQTPSLASSALTGCPSGVPSSATPTRPISRTTEPKTSWRRCPISRSTRVQPPARTTAETTTWTAGRSISQCPRGLHA